VSAARRRVAERRSVGAFVSAREPVWKTLFPRSVGVPVLDLPPPLGGSGSGRASGAAGLAAAPV
jgi:hypothetical protein